MIRLSELASNSCSRLTNYSSNIFVEGLKVYLDLHKTPGPKEYDAIRPLYYPKTVRLSKDIVATPRRF